MDDATAVEASHSDNPGGYISKVLNRPDALSAPSFDATWIHKNLTDMSHVVSNEVEHHRFEQQLTRPVEEFGTGMYLGLGAEQNYSMMAYARPAAAVLFDYDPMVVAAHYINRLAFLVCNTPEEFVSFFEEGNLEMLKGYIHSFYGDRPDLETYLLDIVSNEYTLSKFETRFRGQQTERVYRRSGREFKRTFLSSPERYEYVRKMFQEGRVKISMGNLFDQGFLQSVSQLSQELKEKIFAFYMSNAPDYDTEKFVRAVPAIKQMNYGDNAKLFITSQTYHAISFVGGQWDFDEGDWGYCWGPPQKIPQPKFSQ